MQIIIRNGNEISLISNLKIKNLNAIMDQKCHLISPYFSQGLERILSS